MSASDKPSTNGPSLTFARPQMYWCAKHGPIEDRVITSRIPDHIGAWCQACWIESLVAAGVCKAEPIDEV